MLGDPTLFTRTDEVESAWRFITQILDAWQRTDAPGPATYMAGSWGPTEADELIKADGTKWRRL
jgi:glucose-6-phosphate 1-dehydrogenase